MEKFIAYSIIAIYGLALVAFTVMEAIYGSGLGRALCILVIVTSPLAVAGYLLNEMEK